MPPKITPPREEDINMGKAIKRMRHNRGVSQETLGEKLGITFQQVQKYEKGTNRVSFSRFVDICKALDCHPMDLIGQAYPEWAERADALFANAVDDANKKEAAIRAAVKTLQEVL